MVEISLTLLILGCLAYVFFKDRSINKGKIPFSIRSENKKSI